MKKSLIALAVMAAAGAASAQSSVTLFGVVDATFQWGDGSLTDRTRLANSGYNSSRIGFRGTEDLGGGMSASFWLEAGVNNDDGTGSATNSNNQPSGNPTLGAGNSIAGAQGLTFNRRSTVSLAGKWGELRLGRDYVPQFWNMTIFDPFGTNGVGSSGSFLSGNLGLGGNDSAVRASNSIGYIFPGNLSGFYGQIQYYMGENASVPSANEDDGMGGGIRVGYASGPFNIALAMGRTNLASGDFKTWNVGGQWDFGMAKLLANYADNRLAAPAATIKGKGWLIGGLIPVGAGEIRLSYSTYDVNLATNPQVDKYAIGYVHNLSKRTAVYATYAHVSNDGSANVSLNGSTTAAGGSSSGFDLGIKHSF